MARTWQLQQAKNCFSEVIDEAIAHGPQVITRRGKETAVIISYDEYRSLNARRTKLSEFFRNSPMFGADLDLSRDTSASRDDMEP